MRRLLDTNTWIALTIETHPAHASARRWYDVAPLTRGDLLFCRATELSYLRLITQKPVMSRCKLAALSNAEAIEYLTNAHNDPAVSFAEEAPATRALWLQLAASHLASPNVWMDAYLAALAIALDAEFVTFDHAYRSFEPRGMRLEILQA